MAPPAASCAIDVRSLNACGSSPAAELVVDVAAGVARARAAPVEVGRERRRVVEPSHERAAQEREAVAVLVGPGVRDPRRVEPRGGDRLAALEPVVGSRECEGRIGRRIAPADLREQAPHAARVVIGPAGVVAQVERDESVDAPRGAAGLDRELSATERSGADFDGAAGKAVAPLGLHHDRAAERVEPEHRIRAGHQLESRDRAHRDRVPVDDVAERLVDAHAVLEHRHALRRPEHGRGEEAAEQEVLLERVALGVVERRAGRVPREEARDVVLARSLEVAAAERLDVAGELRQRDAEPGQRGGGDHLDAGQRDGIGRRLRCGNGGGERRRERDRARGGATRHRMTTPQGRLPTGISATSCCCACRRRRPRSIVRTRRRACCRRA
jgi:hypothetical protein